MALLHSRIRRVVFYEKSESGGLGGGGPKTSIHTLRSTNHRFRAFCCTDDFADELRRDIS